MATIRVDQLSSKTPADDDVVIIANAGGFYTWTGADLKSYAQSSLTTPGPYDDDSAAATGGVAVGGQYRLSATNSYGIPSPGGRTVVVRIATLLLALFAGLGVLDAQTILSSAIMDQDTLDTSAPCSGCAQWRYDTTTNRFVRWQDGGWLRQADSTMVADSAAVLRTAISNVTVDSADWATLYALQDTASTLRTAIAAVPTGDVTSATLADSTAAVRADFPSGGSGGALTADGTDTINFASNRFYVEKVDLGSVTRIPTLVFSNPVQWGQYNIHFTDAATDTVYFPENLLIANGDSMEVRLLTRGEILSMYYDGTNYYAPSYIGSTIDTTGWAGVDLAVTKTASNSTPTAGDTVTYTIAITNQAPFDVATGITVKDYLPDSLSNIHNISDSGTLNGTSDTITWTIASIAAGASDTLTFDAQVDGNATNTAAIVSVDQTDTDGSDNSGSVVVTVSAVDTLPVTANLVLHLVADSVAAGTVSSWPDESGNGNNFTTVGGDPTAIASSLNGHSIIDFDGTGDYIAGPNQSWHSGQYTVFAVVKVETTGAFYAIIDGDNSTTGAETRVAQYLRTSTGTDYQAIAFNTAPTSFPATSSGTVSTTGYEYVTIKHSGTTLDIRVDGVSGSSSSPTGTAASDSHPIYLARRWATDAAIVYSDVKIAEVIMYNTALSSGDVSSVESYLATKYGL